jgi:predicted Zn finger-like uncharacterized protein
MQGKEVVKMFTQCRGCGEIFKLSVDDLVTASAMVRCSSCGAVFNSLDTLSDYKPQESSDLILHENDNPPPLLTHEFKQSIVKESIQDNNQINNEKDVSIDSGGEVDIAVHPDFVSDDEDVKVKKPIMLWLLFTLFFLSVLTWQAIEAIKNGSIELPEGKIKQKICERFDCYKGANYSNLDKISLISRSIRQHPGRDNALIITTGIINNDSQVQEFPALQIKMSNLNGEIVAMRRFLPSEYIDAEGVQAGMLPNILIPITLELQSPGKNAVTFEIGFSSTFGAE